MSLVSKDAVLTTHYTCHVYIRHAYSFFTPNFYNNAQSPFVQSIILYQRRSAIRCIPADIAISISPSVVVITTNRVFQYWDTNDAIWSQLTGVVIDNNRNHGRISGTVSLVRHKWYWVLTYSEP